MSLAQKKPNLTSVQGGANNAPRTFQLEKGQLLFAEGDTSKSMYVLKSGIIRIFKKKNTASIEIDTIHSGQILGELAFLDGNPRSASGEALTPCELIEISGPAFAKTVSLLPDWLKLLLKTVVGRLRTASNKIRQLESASSAVDYSGKGGNYIFLSILDVMKIGSALILVASRNGKIEEDGTIIKVSLLQRYANQIMGIPVSKITSFLDILAQVGIIKIDPEKGQTEIIVEDLNFMEQVVFYINEQNLLEAEKKKDISTKSFVILSYISRYVNTFEADEATGMLRINLADVIEAEKEELGKEPFRIDELEQLITLGLIPAPEMKSNAEIFVNINAEKFMNFYNLQRVIKAIENLNNQKASKVNSR